MRHSGGGSDPSLSGQSFPQREPDKSYVKVSRRRHTGCLIERLDSVPNPEGNASNDKHNRRGRNDPHCIRREIYAECCGSYENQNELLQRIVGDAAVYLRREVRQYLIEGLSCSPFTVVRSLELGELSGLEVFDASMKSRFSSSCRNRSVVCR
jgi:hypothetical protein